MSSSLCLRVHWLFFTALVAAPLHCEEAANPPPPRGPKTYALVSLIGNQFNVVSEELGSTQLGLGHLEQLKFKHDVRIAADHSLDLMALQSLDKVVASLEPDSKRVFLTLGVARAGYASATRRDDTVLAGIKEQLKKLPQRPEWDKIVLALPAYRSFDNEGLSSHGGLVKLQGFGVFTQPNATFESRVKEDAVSPEHREVKSDVYVAPYAYIEILVLDAKDLSIIDRQIRYDHQKLADPYAGSLDVNRSVSTQFLATQVIAVIDDSIRKAVLQSKLNEKRGVIELGPLKAVNPANTQ